MPAKTSTLKSNLCDYRDAYIAVKGTKNHLVIAAIENDKAQKNAAFKNILDNAFQKPTVHL